MTTFEPGARLVLTHGFDVRPFSTAFFARRPAAISTDGFDVFVQLVIAAMTTVPCVDAASRRPSSAGVLGIDVVASERSSSSAPSARAWYASTAAVEGRLHAGEAHAILRARRAGEARLDGRRDRA